MTEKVLPFDPNMVPQETGYWCGPASAQTVLQGRGIIMAERDLAVRIGTTNRGTDFVGLIERELDEIVPDARYTSVDLPGVTTDARERLWAACVRSIDAGWGVIQNWVAPPSNKPRGVKGSQTPAYSGGTTYHYIAIMGYDDNPLERALLVADSGFRPFVYWVSFEQAAQLIVPKAYCYADVDGTAPVPAPPRPPRADLGQLLSDVMGGDIAIERYRQLVPAFSDALVKSDCNTMNRVMMFSAQLGHESVSLKYMKELGDDDYFSQYDNRMGNGPGEGKIYPGRGPIQVTGKDNYRKLSKWAQSQGYVDSPAFFVDHPEQLERDQYAFLGAIWYWTVAVPAINNLADAGDLMRVSRAINLGDPNSRFTPNGMPDRTRRWQLAKSIGPLIMQLAQDDWAPILGTIMGTNE